MSTPHRFRTVFHEILDWQRIYQLGILANSAHSSPNWLSYLPGGFYTLQCKISYEIHSEPLNHRHLEGLIDVFNTFISIYINALLHRTISFTSHCVFIPNTFWRRCFWFFDNVVYSYVQNLVEKKNQNPKMAIRGSLLTREAAPAHMIMADSAALARWLSPKAILGFNFFFFPHCRTNE